LPAVASLHVEHIYNWSCVWVGWTMGNGKAHKGESTTLFYWLFYI